MKRIIIRNRRKIQLVIGGFIILAIIYLRISLWYVLALGILSGVIFGKVFCRWMCPLGFIMESMMGNNSDTKQLQLYNYHKLGCPIAWITGALNGFSLFSIKWDKGKCTSCGKCDKVCYISTLNENYSLYNENKKNPSKQYSCSKCLACVDSCPANSLKYKVM